MRYTFLSILILVYTDINAQNIEIEILEFAWVDNITNGRYSRKIEESTTIRSPYIYFKISGKEDLLNTIQSKETLPLRVKWFIKSGLSINRNKTEQPVASLNFSDTTDLAKLTDQLNKNGAFTISIWSKSFKAIDSGNVTASLVYENNKVLDKCDGKECKFEILINQ